MAITILVTNKNLDVVGDPIYNWDNLDCTQRFNAPGSGQFTCPGHSWIREQIEPGNRIVVIRDGDVFTAGPIEQAMYERSDDGENSGDGKYTVTFADDLARIAEMVTYPNPAQTPETQSVAAWTYSGNAELALRNLVNLNVGPGARAERRIPKLELGTLTGVGNNVTVSTRFEPILDPMRSAALAGGGLGFRTRQVDKKILFEVYAPQDKSGTVRFGFGLGNLRYLGYERTAPTGTTAIVGGQGDLAVPAERAVLARTNTAGETLWGRRETLVSRPGSTAQAELQKDGDESLAEAGESARLQSSAFDSDDQRFGIHYGLGDKVSIQVWPGYEVSDLVRIAHLQAWATAGELVSVMVGTQEASRDPGWVRRLRQIDRRMGRLERNVIPAT